MNSLDSIQSLREEVVRANQDGHGTTGNWSVGQIYYHLAATFEGSVEGLPPGYPSIIRLAIRPFRRLVTEKKFPRWIPIPAAIRHKLDPPNDAEAAEQYQRLLRSIDQFSSHDGDFPPHPVLGPLSAQEWLGFHIRHCQHHLSFIQTEKADVHV